MSSAAPTTQDISYASCLNWCSRVHSEWNIEERIYFCRGQYSSSSFPSEISTEKFTHAPPPTPWNDGPRTNTKSLNTALLIISLIVLGLMVLFYAFKIGRETVARFVPTPLQPDPAPVIPLRPIRPRRRHEPADGGPATTNPPLPSTPPPHDESDVELPPLLLPSIPSFAAFSASLRDDGGSSLGGEVMSTSASHVVRPRIERGQNSRFYPIGTQSVSSLIHSRSHPSLASARSSIPEQIEQTGRPRN